MLICQRQKLRSQSCCHCWSLCRIHNCRIQQGGLCSSGIGSGRACERSPLTQFAAMPAIVQIEFWPGSQRRRQNRGSGSVVRWFGGIIMTIDVVCQCSRCTGCEPPCGPDSSECELPVGDLDGVFCHRCGRYVWNECGNERLECPKTGDWLCEVCSGVDCPYPD
jgi:hypothetical protein